MVTLSKAYEQANKYLSQRVKQVVPTLSGVQRAGADFARKNPEAARVLVKAGTISAGTARRVIPEKLGKPTAEAMHAFAKGSLVGIRERPIDVAVSLAIPPALKGAGIIAKGAKATKVGMALAKIPKSGTIANWGTKGVAAAIGVTWTVDTHRYITQPVVTGYRSSVQSTKKETLPDGSIKETQTIKETPILRNPNRNEMIERFGVVYSSQLAPLSISSAALSKGIRKGTTTEWKPHYIKRAQPKRTVVTKITKAGKEIKRTTRELLKEEKAEAPLIRKKRKAPQKQIVRQKLEQKEKVIDVATHKGPVIVEKNEMIVLDLRNVKVTSTTKQVTKQLQKQQTKYNTLTKQQLKLEAKLIQIQKQLAKQTTKAKRAQMLKQRQKLKSKQSAILKQKQKTLLLLRSKLNQLQKQLTKTVTIQKQKTKVIAVQKARVLQKTRTKQKTLQKQRSKLMSKQKSLMKQISRTKSITKQKSLQKQLQAVNRQLQRIEKILPVTVVLPKKEEKLKNKIKVQKDIKEAFVKNPVPSLKEFLK